MIRFLLSFALLTAALLSAACSISESSKSSSASSESISDSASSPSSSVPAAKDKKKAGYENDIRDYTAEFVKSSDTNPETFRARLGKIAAKYGVTQWDQDKSTYVAIGKGLRKASLGKSQL
ncbi:MAG: putative lipoprotein [Candidatus Methylumidiphilus sp.]